jgi:hypothetical protein
MGKFSLSFSYSTYFSSTKKTSSDEEKANIK